MVLVSSQSGLDTFNLITVINTLIIHVIYIVITNQFMLNKYWQRKKVETKRGIDFLFLHLSKLLRVCKTTSFLRAPALVLYIFARKHIVFCLKKKKTVAFRCISPTTTLHFWRTQKLHRASNSLAVLVRYLLNPDEIMIFHQQFKIRKH